MLVYLACHLIDPEINLINYPYFNWNYEMYVRENTH